MMQPFYQNRQEPLNVSEGGNLVFPPHLHVGLELIYLFSGEMDVRIGEQQRLLQAGDCAIAFPNVIHGYERREGETRHLLLFCLPAVCGDFAPALLESCPEDPFIPRERLHPDVPYALRRLAELQEEPDMPVARALVQLILARLMPGFTLRPHGLPETGSLPARLIGYLSAHFCEPLSLDILAGALGVSPYSISRVFNHQLHTGFCDCLNAYRIGLACELLADTREDILSIGLKCGYENPRSFSRAFRRICGCSPRQYRQERRKITAGNDRPDLRGWGEGRP